MQVSQADVVPVRKVSLRVRVATWLFPPAGLVLLWLAGGRWRDRLLGTFGILLYTPVYVALILFLLVRFTGMQTEWRGGMIPAFTYHKTLPNYDALEQQRAASARAAAPKVVDVHPPYWTDFRGPLRDGQYNEQPINTHWPATGLRQLWRQPVGGGYASFVVAKGMAFTIEQRREEEAVVAYDLLTGHELWVHKYRANFRESMGGDGPRATPTWHDGRLYSLGAEGDFKCLDAATGKELWARNVLRDGKAANLMYGMSTSPLIVDDKVIVLTGDAGGTGHWVLAYDRLTGDPRWQALEDKGSYASPMLVTLAGERQLLVVGGVRAAGLSPADGQVLWDFPQRVSYDNNIAQPVIMGPDQFMLSAGYGSGATAFRLTREGDKWVPKELWMTKLMKNKFSSSVLWEGYLYGLDEDILACVDAATGERKWKGGRYGYGQLLLASGHLVILSGTGELALVKATPVQPEEIARFQAIEGKTWNYPAIAEGKILVRNSVEMACYDLSP